MDDTAAATTLITGATGFLGRHLVAALAGHLRGLPPAESRRARRIHIVSSRAYPVFEGVDPAAVTTHHTDLTDGTAVERLVDEIRPDELFHLAWFNGASADRYADPANHDWVAVTEHLVESFARAGGRRAIVAGSCIEYGPEGGSLSEGRRADPDTVYGRCKLDAGLRALAIGDEYPGLAVAVARIFFVLGRYEEPNRLVPYIISQLLAGEPAELSSGTQERDYLHAWDVALGLIAVADSPLTGHVNIGRGEAISVKELAQLVGTAVGRPDLLWFGARPGGPDSAEVITADISLITDRTEWRPQLDLKDAAADVVNWWSAQLGTSAGRH